MTAFPAPTVSGLETVGDFFEKRGSTCCAIRGIVCVSRYRKEAGTVADKSRAEYFKKRRESKKTFSVVLDKDRLESLEEKLSQQNITKTEWLNRKIDEELGK